MSLGLLQDMRACPAFRRVGAPPAAAAGGAGAAGAATAAGVRPWGAYAEQAQVDATAAGIPVAQQKGTPAVHLTKLSNSVGDMLAAAAAAGGGKGATSPGPGVVAG